MAPFDIIGPTLFFFNLIFAMIEFLQTKLRADNNRIEYKKEKVFCWVKTFFVCFKRNCYIIYIYLNFLIFFCVLKLIRLVRYKQELFSCVTYIISFCWSRTKNKDFKMPLFLNCLFHFKLPLNKMIPIIVVLRGKSEC